MIQHLHKSAKLSPSFSPEVCICLRSCMKHLHLCLITFPNTLNFCGKTQRCLAFQLPFSVLGNVLHLMHTAHMTLHFSCVSTLTPCLCAEFIAWNKTKPNSIVIMLYLISDQDTHVTEVIFHFAHVSILGGLWGDSFQCGNYQRKNEGCADVHMCVCVCVCVFVCACVYACVRVCVCVCVDY